MSLLLSVRILLLSLFLITTHFASAQTLVIEYDSLLAKQYKADDYGMKTYVMAFLERGPNRDLPKEEADQLQSQHMANISKLAEEGKLIVAGPFYGDGDLRGIYLFDTESIEDAEEWTATDPAIIAGSLKMKLLKWYGSAALMAVPEMHDKVSKVKF